MNKASRSAAVLEPAGSGMSNETLLATCDHCLIEFPGRQAVRVEIDGAGKTFCCHGCRGVYQLIRSEGLDDFYRRRGEWAPGPSSAGTVDPAPFSPYVRPEGEELETDIMLDGIRCASCVWLNEKILMRTPGVTFARVNYATHRARIRWNPAETGLQDVLSRIAAIGYTPKPFIPSAFEDEGRRASRDLLLRLGTAGFLSMQLMIYSFALYAGYFQGMDRGIKDLFNVIELLLTTPALFYAGWPFLTGAVRGIRNRMFNMDVLVAAGAGSAYFYSIYQMIKGGEVYFDTAVMIITLILLGRYIENGAKRKASETIMRLFSLAPQEARKAPHPALGMQDDASENAGRVMVPVASLRPGDFLEVIPGERVPMDGVVREGRSELDESMLTGESKPAAKQPGSDVYSGTLNLYGRFVYEVTKTKGDSALARIIKAVEDAQSRRAPIQSLADRVAAVFVPAVLLLAVVTGAAWYLGGTPASAAIMNAVSVLVIACPCALGLATPLAILAGTACGASKGIVIKGGDVIERASRIDCAVFDKTGTVTEGKPSLLFHHGVGMPDESALRIAASLERFSEHSLGKAVTAAAAGLQLENVADFAAAPGAGVRGIIAGNEALLGSREFIEAGCAGNGLGADETSLASTYEAAGATVFYLSYDGRPAGLFVVSDQPRREASEAVSLLKRRGCKVAMLTGDAASTAGAVASAVGIDSVEARRSPLQKADALRSMRSRGIRCAMVGDGINDAPALVEAEVGVAMGRASDIALESADMVLVRNDLRLVPQALQLARKTFTVIRQNLFWAFFYNAVAIPLAIAGVLHPVVAAGAMALSSLSVVANSLRARVK